MGATAAQDAAVSPATAGSPVRSPASSISAVVSLGKTLHPHRLLMVVREISGACIGSIASLIFAHFIWSKLHGLHFGPKSD